MNNEPEQKNTTRLPKKILEFIEHEHITPVSRSHYVWKNGLFWTLWGLTILIGAAIASILIFTELNIGWEYYEITHQNALTFFVASLPYLWVVLVVLFVLLSIYNFRMTKKGYRHSVTFLILLGLSGSLIGGLILHFYGVGEYLESSIGEHVPFNTPVMHAREAILTQPDRGMYAGKVETFDPDAQRLVILTYNNGRKIFTTQFLPPETLEGIGKDVNVRILATTSSLYEDLVACHLALLEERAAHTLGDIEARRSKIHDEFNEFLQGEERDFTAPVSSNPCTRVVLPQYTP